MPNSPTIQQQSAGSVPPLTPAILASLRRVVGADAVITDPAALLVYESDGLTAHRSAPRAVVLPRSTSEVAATVRLLSAADIPFVARGAGTGLSGGALAVEGAVVVSLARMNRILELDPANRRAVVEAGVVNATLSRAAARYGLYYAPDPSSQSACTIGGNVAENAGGPHCLKYGVTTNYVTGLVVVLPDGEVIRLGGLAEPRRRVSGAPIGYDLVGLFVGSEGTLGIATEIEVGLLPLPEGVETLLALFDRVEDASEAVSAIIAAGLLPAALELIDRETIRAVEASIFAAGLPTDLGAALVIEFDGARAGLAADAARAASLCHAAGARAVQRARDDTERERLWQARKKAFGALGRLAPDLLVQDAVVPRSRLAAVVHATYEIAARHDLRISNVFHAGDGNLHPTILFDRRDPDQLRRVEAASREIMEHCIAVGGTITGEHGVGLDKLAYMSLIHDDIALDLMRDLRHVFDPAGLANPGKLLPPRPRGTPRPTPPPPPHSAERAKGLPPPQPLPQPSPIFDHEPADLVVSASAELTLGELQDRLAGAGQWLPLDPPGGTTTSLGELVARASAGPLQEGYGTLRDHLLGLQLVTGDGRIIECGGRVMKNVAGYDLVRLVVGSRGTLGLVTRVDLRLRALPEADRTIAFSAADHHPLCTLVAALRTEGVGAVALEILSPAASNAICARADWLLLVRLQGNTPAVAAAADRAQRLAAAVRGVELDRTTSSTAPDPATPVDRASAIPAGANPVWKALAELEAQAGQVTRLADLPSRLPQTLDAAVALAGRAADSAPIVAHAGLGVARVLGAGRADQPGRADQANATNASNEADPTDRVALLEREIRRCFDPQGSLRSSRRTP